MPVILNLDPRLPENVIMTAWSLLALEEIECLVK